MQGTKIILNKIVFYGMHLKSLVYFPILAVLVFTLSTFVIQDVHATIPSPPTSPVITSPTSGATVASPLKVSGTATSGYIVYIYNNDVKIGESSRVGSNGNWQVTLQLAPGSYNLVTRAEPADKSCKACTESDPSAAVPITINSALSVPKPSAHVLSK